MPPKRFETISKADILRKYRDDNWEEKVKDYNQVVIEDYVWTPEPGRTTIRKRGIKYVNAQGDLEAVIFYYTHPDNSVTTAIRQLREGEIIYYVL